jgi:hypothetical protein
MSQPVVQQEQSPVPAGAQPPHRPSFTVRRNAALFGIVGALACVLGVAFLARGNGLVDVVLGGALVVVGAVHLFALAGARHPLLEADDEGVRVRVGTGWQRLPWDALRQVVVERPESVLRDGRLVVQPRDPGQLTDLGLFGRVHGVWSRRWYGASLGVPLAMTTTTSGDDPVGDLRELAAGRTEVVELHGRHLASLTEVPARLGALVSRVGNGTVRDVDTADEPLLIGDDPDPAAPEPALAHEVDVVPVESRPEVAPVLPLREPVVPQRAELSRAVPAAPGQLGEDDREARAAAAPRLQTFLFDATGEPARDAGPAATPEPVIGPVIARARERVRLSIDQLSERTRIRPHVLAAIEVDDFDPCGGDFYARGHLTTLARALGLELAPLMREYDDRYAHGPINARRVFEAELATGLSGGMRAASGGPRWSLLVAAVLCLMLVWGVARMFSDAPEQVAVPDQDTTAGLAANHQPIVSPRMKLRTMTVAAAHAPATVVVKDRTGRVLWSGRLAQGQTRKVVGLAPFEVRADNAGAVEVTVVGQARGTLGRAGAPGARTFG